MLLEHKGFGPPCYFFNHHVIYNVGRFNSGPQMLGLEWIISDQGETNGDRNKRRIHDPHDRQGC